MNTNNNENGNSSIPDVPELVLEDGLTPEEITERVVEHNQAVTDYKTKVSEANTSLYARTKKAEGFTQDADGKWVKPAADVIVKKPEVQASENSDKDGLSQADLITVMRSNIPEEDLPELVEYAKFKKVSIAEALQSSVIKSMLAENKEARDVAEGSNTNGGRRGSGRLSDEALMDNAQKGILPESDEDMRRLSALSRKSKK